LKSRTTPVVLRQHSSFLIISLPAPWYFLAFSSLQGGCQIPLAPFFMDALPFLAVLNYGVPPPFWKGLVCERGDGLRMTKPSPLFLRILTLRGLHFLFNQEQPARSTIVIQLVLGCLPWHPPVMNTIPFLCQLRDSEPVAPPLNVHVQGSCTFFIAL